MPSDKNIITAAVPAEFQPHYSLDKSGNPQGFAIDVMDKIAETAGLKVRYIVKKNWGEVFKDLRSGRADLIPNLGITEKRKLDFDFTMTVETFPISIFVREGTHDIKGQDDLSGRNIAAVKDNAAVILLEGREDINLKVFNDPREALFDLLAGHTDALVYPETVTRKLAQTIRVEDRIKIAGKPLIELKRAIAVRKGNTVLLDRLNKAVDAFQHTEEYNRIFVKWHGKPTEFWSVHRVVWTMGWVIVISIAVVLLWRYRTVARLNINLIKTVEERKRADEEIEHQKTMFESIFNGVADAIVLTDPQRKIVTCNPAFTRILGYSLQDIIGKETGVFYESWEVFKRMGKERFNLSAEEKLKPYVVTYRRKDGTLFPGETIGTVIHGKKCAIVGFLGVIRDITERNLAEEELIKKNGYIKLLQEITAKANESKTTEEILQFCLDKVRALTKWPVGHVYTASEVNSNLMVPTSIWSMEDDSQFNEFRIKTDNFKFPIGGGLPGRVLASAKPAWITDVRTDPDFARAGLAREAGLISAFAFPILSGSSVSAVLEFYSEKATEPDEELLEIMAQIGTQTGRVIERQRAEEALHSSEVSLASAQKIAHVGSWEWDIVLNKVTWSDEAYRLYGYEPEAVEPTLDVFLDTVHPDDRDKVLKDVNEAISENKQYVVDHRVIGPDGIERIVHAIGKVVSHDKEGKPLCIVGTVSDVTKRKKAEEELQSTKLLLEKTFASLNEAVFVVNPDSRNIIAVNPAVERLFGYSMEELIGRNTEIVHIDRTSYEKFGKKMISELEPNGIYRAEYRMRKKDGTIILCDHTVTEIRDESGKCTELVGVFTDITEKRMMERELLKTQKLESLSLLAGGIAHDFNNILMGVLGNISLAKFLNRSEKKPLKILEEAEKAAIRAKGLTSQLLTFSTGGTPLKNMARINDILIEVSLFALRGSNSKMVKKLEKNLATVNIDSDQITQVLNNLLINADQAMPDGGIITLRGENITLNDDEEYPLPGGKYVKISVEDNGKGIPPDIIDKIFDPFFTTKKDGNGLGLSTSYSIIKKHEGLLKVTSIPGEGSLFHIYLPATDGFVRRKSRDRIGTDGKGKILVMDDDELVRDVLAEMLAVLGYESELAQDGEEAEKKYADAMERGEQFAAVILDLTVRGGMGGKQAMEKLKEMDPNVNAIVSSGYSTDIVVEDYGRFGFSGYVTKPYELKTLSKVLSKTIRASV